MGDSLWNGNATFADDSIASEDAICLVFPTLDSNTAKADLQML